jgi:hypothetical protein
MRRGEYGYDAPYAVVIFGAVAAASAVAATIGWREGETRVTARMTMFCAFFLAKLPASTRPDGAVHRMGSPSDRLQLRGDERVLDMGVVMAQS